MNSLALIVGYLLILSLVLFFLLVFLDWIMQKIHRWKTSNVDKLIFDDKPVQKSPKTNILPFSEDLIKK